MRYPLLRENNYIVFKTEYFGCGIFSVRIRNILKYRFLESLV